MGGKSSTLELKNCSKYFKRNIQVDYEIKNHLAIGEFSIIYDAESRDTKYQRAIQEFSRSQMTEEDYIQLSETINILQEIRCPNIVKLYEVFEMPYSYYLVYEKMKPETLMEVILKRKEDAEKYHFPGNMLFKAEEIKNYMWQILYALSVCFSHSIIHKDIRPENFLIDGDELTLIDFRLAQFVQEKPKFKTRQTMIYKSSPLEAVNLMSMDSLPDEDEGEGIMIRSGTNFNKIKDFEDKRQASIQVSIPKLSLKEDTNLNANTTPHKKFGQVHYRAPETFMKEYYYQSDIWSAGVIFYILCTGNLPPFNLQGNKKKAAKMQLSDRQYYVDTPRFSNASKSKKKSETISEEFTFIDEIHDDILSEEGKNLMKQMFSQIHYMRISAPIAMRHEYFKKNQNYKEINIDQIKKTIINCVNNSQVCYI